MPGRDDPSTQETPPPASLEKRANELPEKSLPPVNAKEEKQDTTDTLPDNTADGREIGFEANTLEYNSDTDTVTAGGNVIMRSEGQSVRADNVTWDRTTGQIVATGNIRFVDEDGNQLFTDRLELTDELQTGAMENLLLALREGGRLAAREGQRDESGDVLLTSAAYSACSVETPDGCPKKPSWRITAKRVIYDQNEKRIRFKGAHLELFGVRLLPLPGMAVTTDNRAVSGLLLPDFGVTASNGVEVSDSYYLSLAENQDLKLKGFIYSDAPPMGSAQYRLLTDAGALQVTGYLTRSSRMQVNSDSDVRERDWRGYVAANGRFQLDEYWSVTGSLRRATDRTFLRRYDISRDDRLRSNIDVERIDDNSYLSISGWATQVLLTDQDQDLVPIALPLIDYRYRFKDPIAGGKLQLQANSLAITRTAGQDTQRAFAKAQWDMRTVTSMGQEITLTGLVRGDVYHSDENLTTETASYRGLEGWETRGIALAAVDVKWPLIGKFLDGSQIFTPRAQLVASPNVKNLDIPNEDARAIELEDSNLFSLNRFPGYDRVEDGVRFTYGFDWQFQRPGLQISTTVGQSYRLTDKPSLFPNGTGLSNRFSDFVGRTEVRLRDFVKFTHRFRLDKDSLAVRRNEVDATVGTDRTYAEIGYLRLDRNIESNEDLQDREELRAAGRIAFANYWSVFGSAVINLTDRREDPTLASDGFEPLRTRLGIAYSDDCLELGVTWRRDYVRVADARSGNTFQVYFSLRNLGFR
ncbi:LPS-assembly protein LptD [Altericroceibacterium spongiae]|nr:LPS assembly protein LptD [Altericroceibacterium spongiae]